MYQHPKNYPKLTNPIIGMLNEENMSIPREFQNDEHRGQNGLKHFKPFATSANASECGVVTTTAPLMVVF